VGIKEGLISLFFRKKETKNSSLGNLLQRLCINLQTANFLGDFGAERRAFASRP